MWSVSTRALEEWTYIIIDFGWRLHVRRLVFEYQSWEDPCNFILSVQLEINQQKVVTDMHIKL